MSSVMTEWRRKNPERALAMRREYDSKNRIILNEKRRKYRAENPHIVRNQWYKKKYGISYEQYNEMRDRQESRCAICRKPSWECQRMLAVDHDHKTGKNRGLLCTGCNIVVGFIEKRGMDSIRSVEAYLETHK